MKHDRLGRHKIQQLFRTRNRFDPTSSRQKLELIRQLHDLDITSARDLRMYHDALCYVRAFPDTKRLFQEAHKSLVAFRKRIDNVSAAREELSDSGIGGTAVHYSHSYEVAKWLARHARGEISIEWAEVGNDTARLDELLGYFLLPVETDYFDSGYVSSEEWVNMVSAAYPGTDFDWLFTQIRSVRPTVSLAQLYDAVDLPLVWQLGNSRFSKSTNVLPVRSLKTRRQGMRKVGGKTATEIQRPLASMPRLPASEGRQLINVAMAALAVRHRETLHFDYANPDEVYLANVGAGTSIAVFGLRGQFRYPLECTMGFLILSNGVPIGYGGSSVVFRQANTGVNIFSEYRGSEASYLWVQVMRVYHNLFGCNRFIANAYQFGEENDEALRSGAYWFYYRLGFRSVSPEIKALASKEHTKILAGKNYKSSSKILRRLASCDMHLTLPAARASEYFDESLFDTVSLLATRELGAAGGNSRADAIANVIKRVAKELGIRGLENWSQQERYCLGQLAPILAATDISSWPAAAKGRARKILRAKGGTLEARYARLLGENQFLCQRLRAACRAAAPY